MIAFREGVGSLIADCRGRSGIRRTRDDYHLSVIDGGGWGGVLLLAVSVRVILLTDSNSILDNHLNGTSAYLVNCDEWKRQDEHNEHKKALLNPRILLIGSKSQRKEYSAEENGGALQDPRREGRQRTAETDSERLIRRILVVLGFLIHNSQQESTSVQ